MRGSVRFMIHSQVELNVLKEAAEHVRDFEGDMCVDLSHDLVKAKGKGFDETLADIVDMRRRVAAAGDFIESLGNKLNGDEVFAGPCAQEVLDRGLEFLQDQLNDSITEAFYTEKFKNGTDAAGIVELRESVERALDRADTCDRLLKYLRETLGR